MVRVSSPAKLRPWSELTATMVMGLFLGWSKRVKMILAAEFPAIPSSAAKIASERRCAILVHSGPRKLHCSVLIVRSGRGLRTLVRTPGNFAPRTPSAHFTTHLFLKSPMWVLSKDRVGPKLNGSVD